MADGGPRLVEWKEARAWTQAGHAMAALHAVRRLVRVLLIAGEEGGTRVVAVKCIDITKNPDCGGSLPARK